MSSYAELHQQQGGLLATEARHGYADLYLHQQAEAATRRSYSSFNPRQAADAAARRSQSSEQYRVVVSTLDEDIARQPPPLASPGSKPRTAALTAAVAAAAVNEVVAARMRDSSPSGRPEQHDSNGASSPSPTRPRLDPSVSRPATTILAQATAMRAARLKQLAQRQLQAQQPQPAPTSAAGRRGTARQQVLLSAVLQQAPYLYDRQRLSAVERFIDRIDAVQARIAEAQVVFLSKNSLTSVAGLEQFRDLRVLGLADNLLADPEQLEALAAACPKLEALSLEGNPIAYVPHYRSRVVLALPGLKSLDGRPVTDEERASAPSTVAAEEATMAVLLRNACEVHKMASVVQRAQMHMELLHSMYSKGAVLQRVEALGSAGGRSLSRLVDMWDYEAMLTPEERRKIRGALLREVGRMFRQLKVQQPESARAGPSWEEAFAHVMTAQQQTTAALLDLMTQCQLAIDELVRGMAAPLGHGPSDTLVGLDGSGGGAGGAEGRGAARELLLREAEADVERNRAMRQEREEVLAEFRDTALKRARSSPMRPALRPVLKSSLKRPTQPHSKPAADGDGDGPGSDGADSEDRRSPSAAPPRWQSARSSPLAPEAVERLMRARRGVAPTRSSVSSTGGTSEPRAEEAVAMTRSATALPSQHPLQASSRPLSVGASADATSANGRGLRRPASADRTSPNLLDQQQRASQAVGGRSYWRGSSGASVPMGHRRSKSVDTAGLRGRGTGGAGAGSDRRGSASVGRARQRQRLVESASPEKSPLSSSPTMDRPVWRPAGGKQGGARSQSSSPSYMDVSQAVSRAFRARAAHTQEMAGTSPERVSSLMASTAVALSAASGSPNFGPGSVPDRAQTSSPTIRGRRHSSAAGTGAAGTMPPSLATAGHEESLQHGSQARRSLQDALLGSSPLRSIPSASGGDRGAYRASSQESRLRASSPAGPWSMAASRDAHAQAAMASARIDDLKRQVEESARETARLRYIAEAASQPLAQWTAAGLGGLAPVGSSQPPPQLPQWPAAAHDGTVRAPPPPWSQAPPRAPGQDSGFAAQTGPPAGTAPTAVPEGPQAQWGRNGPAGQGLMLSPYPDVTLRPREWTTSAGPAASPQPQPQVPPPSLQPHRSSWPGPSPPGSEPGPHDPHRTLAAEGSGAGFVDLYPSARAPGQSGHMLPQQFQEQQQRHARPIWAGPPGGPLPVGYASPRDDTLAPPSVGPQGSYPAPHAMFEMQLQQQQQQQQQQHYQQQQTVPAHMHDGVALAERWRSEGPAPHGGQVSGPSAGPRPGSSYSTMPIQQPQPQHAPASQEGIPASGQYMGVRGLHGVNYTSSPQPGVQGRAPPQLRLQPPPFPAGPGAVPPPASSMGQGLTSSASSPLQPPVAHPQPGFQANAWLHQDTAAPPPQYGRGVAWPPSHVAADLNPQLGAGGPSASPRTAEPFVPPTASPPAYGSVPAPSYTPGQSDQVTLDDFSLMRASLDVVPPGSMQPSVTGTPSYGQHPGTAASPFPYQPYTATDGAETPMDHPVGVVDTPWQPGLPGQPHHGDDYVDFSRPHITASVGTPGFTLRGPPGTIGTAMPNTPGATTIVSVVDDGGGGGGTRVDVEEEVVGEDSTGSNDQHIHLHIHPPPVQVPGTATTDASTPQLFLQGAHEQHRSGPVHASQTAGPSPGDSMAASLGILAPPGSPLHEALSAGNLVYEKIERIMPAGRPATPESRRETARDATTATLGTSVEHSFDDRAGRSTRRSARRRRGRPSPSDSLDRDSDRDSDSGRVGGGGRCRSEQPGFGYGHHDDSSSGGDDDGRRGSRASGGDSFDVGRDTKSGGASKSRDGQGSRSSHGHGGDSRSDHGKRARRTAEERSPGVDTHVEEEDDLDDTDRSRDDDNSGRRTGTGHGDSREHSITGDGSSRGGGTPGRGPGRGPLRRKRGANERREGSRGAVSEARTLEVQVLEVLPPVVQEQYATLQRQLAEQAAMNASLADQLQKLQSLVAPAATPDYEQQQPDEAPGLLQRTHGAISGYADEGTRMESWTSGGAGSVPGRASGVDSIVDPAGGDGGVAAAMSSPPPLHPQVGPAMISPRDTTQSWATTLSGDGPSRISQRTIRPISPVLPAASGGRSPRDSSYSTMSVLPDRAQGSPRPSAIDPGAAVAGLSGRSPQGGSSSQQIQDQLLRNRSIQEQISRLGEQLAGAAMSAAGMELPPDLAATLAGLAASSSPLPPGSLRALEQQLVALTLEKEAVERVLLQEQAEVRLLQQELGVMSQVADALEESQAQLQETRLAVAHQQQELQERDQQLAVSRERETELMAELAAERERAAAQVAAIASYFEQQFEDARTAVVNELREQMAAMQAAARGPATSQPRTSFRAQADSQPDSVGTEFETHPPGRRSDLLSQLSPGGAHTASHIAQNLEEQLSSRTAAGRTDLASHWGASLSSAPRSSHPSGQRSDSTPQTGSMTSDAVTQLEAALSSLPEELRSELAAQIDSSRASLASKAAALRADILRQLQTQSGPAATPSALSRLVQADLEAEHAAQLAIIDAEHKTQIEALHARHAAQIEALLAEKAAQPEAIRQEYAEQLMRVRTEHVNQLEEVRTLHAAQVEELLAEGARKPEALRTEHTAKIAAMRNDHAKQLEALRAEHAEQLGKLLAERSAQPEALRAEHATKLAALREEHAAELKFMRADHATQMEVLLAERAMQPDALRVEHASQLTALRLQHAKQTELLRAEHAKEVGILLAERAALPEALRAEHAAQLEAMRNEHAARLGAMRADHAVQMETLRASHASQLEALLADRSTQPDTLRAEHGAQLAALRVEHAKQVEAMRTEHQKQLDHLAAERAAQQPEVLRAEHAAQMATLRAEHTKHMEAMRAELTSQIDSLLAERMAVSQALRDEHATQLETVRATHAASMASQSVEHAKQMEAMRTEHAKQMERLLLEHAAQPEVLRAGYSTQVAALRAEHAMVMEALRAEHATALAEKERQRASLLAAHEQQLHDLRAEHQQHVEELAAQARQRLQHQEAEHRALATALAEEHQVQLSQHTRRLDELLTRHKQQLDDMAEANRGQLEEVRRQGEKLLVEARTSAERAAAEAIKAHEVAMAELAGRLRAAEAEAAAAVSARREADAVRTSLQTELDEALTLLGRERIAASELRGRNQALEVAEMEVRRRMEKLMVPQELGWRREMEADRLGSRLLLRRVLGNWATNADLSRRHKHQLAIAGELRRRRVCRQAMQQWRTAVLRTRVLRSLLREHNLALMRRALVSLKAQALHRRRRSRVISIALAHWSVRFVSRCFDAWRQVNRMHARAAAYSDPAALRAAVAHHSTGILRAALAAWQYHVFETKLPKTQLRRRAAQAYRRRLLRKSLSGFTKQAARRAVKRNQLARSIRRHRFSVLNRALACWLRYLDGARRKRSLLSMADIQYGHSVIQRWHRAAARSRALRRGLATLQASAGTRRLRMCMARWRAFLLRRRQSALADRLASEHYRSTLQWRCLCAWLQLAQQSAARQLHIKGMQDYQRMMQAALRWQRLVELGRRQQAVVDRAVRLYRHRVLAATQRAVLRHWRAAVEERRGLLRSAAVSFVHAYLSIWRRKVFSAWYSGTRRAVAERGVALALELRTALERNEGAMRQLSTRLESMGAESAALQDQLKEAKSEVLLLQQQLTDSEKELAAAVQALSNAQREVEVQGVALAERGERLAGLEGERDALLERVQTLRQQVAAGEVSIASLQEQATALQRSFAAAQGSVRELGVKMQQQAGHYEEQLLAARDEASLARREAGSLAATASRLEQQAADSEAQLRAVRTGHEALVASLRQELRSKDAHIMALSQQQQQQRESVAQSRPGSARLPSPAFSPRPLSADPRPRIGAAAAAAAAGAGILRESRAPWAAAQPSGSASGADLSSTRGAVAAEAGVEAEDSTDRWEPAPRDGGARARPLFEPSAFGPAASAAAATARQVESRPWSTGSQRTPVTTAAPVRSGGRAAPVSGALLRTSLLTQPLLPSRDAADPAPPRPRAAQRQAEAEELGSEDAGIWADNPMSRSANDATTAAATAAEAAVAAADGAARAEASPRAAAAVVAPSTSDQLPARESSEWPPVQESAAASTVRDSSTGLGGDGDDDDDLPPPVQHRGASGAFRRLQAAEAALRATEEEFQRRRSYILGLDVSPSIGDAPVAASGTVLAGPTGPPQPQRTLSPRLDVPGTRRRASSSGGAAVGVGMDVQPQPQQRPQQRSAPGADEVPKAPEEDPLPGPGPSQQLPFPERHGGSLRHSASDLLDRSLQAAAESLEALSPRPAPSGARGQPHSQQQYLPARRHATTDPGDIGVRHSSSAAADDGSGGISDGGALSASQGPLRDTELKDLTAGIVGTLTNLREALRAQSRPPPGPHRPGPPLPPQPPSSSRSEPAAAKAAAISGGGAAPIGRSSDGGAIGAIGARGLGRGGAASVTSVESEGAGHRTVTIRPTTLTSIFVPEVGSDAAELRSGGTTSGGGAVTAGTGSSSSDAIDVTLRDLLRATMPPPPPMPSPPGASSAGGLVAGLDQDQQRGAPARLSRDSAFSDTSRMADASDMLSRSLASLISGAAEAAAAAIAEAAAAGDSGAGDNRSAPQQLERRSSVPSSVMRWLQALTPVDSGDLDRYSVPAVAPQRPQQPLMVGPERSHELYTRIGAHVASVVEEGLVEAAAGSGVSVLMGRTSLRRTVDVVPAEDEDEYATIDADAL